MFFYKRYIDDASMIIHKDSINDILNIFTNYDRNLKFTYEIVTDHQLIFLDMTLIRTDILITAF